MCTFNLTLVPACGHELPTIDYCSAAKPDVKAYKQALKIGKKVVEPPKTCTESLGWRIYKNLGAPVECETCVEWLSEQGKRTWGGVADEGGNGVGRKKGVKWDPEVEGADGDGSEESGDLDSGKESGVEEDAGQSIEALLNKRGLDVNPPPFRPRLMMPPPRFRGGGAWRIRR